MAETTATGNQITSLKEAKAALAATNAQREKDREVFRKARAEEAKKQAEQAAVEAKRVKELKLQIKGPDKPQVGADIAGMVVGEGVFRALSFALSKLGAKSAWWYVALPSALGTALYVVAYPRREEGLARKAARATGLYWQIVGLHDGIGYLMQNRSDNAAAVAKYIAENEELRRAVAAAGAAQPPR